MRHPGIEPGPPRWQRGIITTRLMTLDSWQKRGQGGLEPPTSRTRSENHTSRPLALRCMGEDPIRRRYATAPIENNLVRATIATGQSKPKTNILRPGIEPGTYCVLGSRHNQLDHRSFKSILGGTRTHNLEIRSLTPYPLGHEDTGMRVGRTRSGTNRRTPPMEPKRICLEWGSNPRILSNT